MKPLANINTRISALLSISLRSYNRLKRKKRPITYNKRCKKTNYKIIKLKCAQWPKELRLSSWSQYYQQIGTHDLNNGKKNQCYANL